MKKLIIATFILLLAANAFAGEKKQEPLRAVLYSAILPGGGQIYNQAYLKAGLVIGAQSFLIGSTIYHNRKRDEYFDLAQHTTDLALQQQYLAESRYYKDRVNNDIWWIGITTSLSVIDAYIDAYLFDFESEKEKIRLRFEGTGIKLQYRF